MQAKDRCSKWNCSLACNFGNEIRNGELVDFIDSGPGIEPSALPIVAFIGEEQLRADQNDLPINDLQNCQCTGERTASFPIPGLDSCIACQRE